MLFASMVLVGVVRSASGGLTPAAVLSGAGLLAWYGAGVVPAVRGTTSASRIWLAGLAVGCLGAVWTTPDFAWVCFAAFVTFANNLPAGQAVWSIAALAVSVGGILVGRWPGDGHWASQLVGPIVGASVAGALVGISRLAAAESAGRQRLVDELLGAREELARAHLDAGARAERERINREIHDTLAQSFTSVVLTARRGRHAVAGGNLDLAGAELGLLEDIGRGGVEDSRRLLRRLPPAELDQRPLPAALGLIAKGGARDGRPSIEVRVDGEARALDGAVDVTLLRVAQEAVANARRHSGAKRVVVTLTYQPCAVRLDVADDGVGFDPLARSGKGFGLSGMRSRIAQVGGDLVIESAPGHGAAVNATIPLES